MKHPLKKRKNNRNRKDEQIFVIMALGQKDTEQVWAEVYEPVISAFGYKPVRTDKTYRGGLLIEGIYNDINNSKFIIGDLTHERPNCYLEIGYSIGIGKVNDPLILCCRKDHAPEHIKRKKKQRKIHFDLAGYRILWWDLKNLNGFKKELKASITARDLRMPKSEKID